MIWQWTGLISKILWKTNKTNHQQRKTFCRLDAASQVHLVQCEGSVPRAYFQEKSKREIVILVKINFKYQVGTPAYHLKKFQITGMFFSSISGTPHLKYLWQTPSTAFIHNSPFPTSHYAGEKNWSALHAAFVEWSLNKRLTSILQPNSYVCHNHTKSHY